MKAVAIVELPDDSFDNGKWYFDKICYTEKDSLFDANDMWELKPLPEKKYGRLIDADAYLKKVCTYRETGCGSCRLQTICPADEPTINDRLDEIIGETE